jgi:hypothetical protein
VDGTGAAVEQRRVDVAVPPMEREASAPVTAAAAARKFAANLFESVTSLVTTLTGGSGRIQRTVHPRMPWHDVALAVGPPASCDVAYHFIQRWNHHRLVKREADQPLLMPRSPALPWWRDLDAVDPPVPGMGPTLPTAPLYAAHLRYAAATATADVQKPTSAYPPAAPYPQHPPAYPQHPAPYPQHPAAYPQPYVQHHGAFPSLMYPAPRAGPVASYVASHAAHPPLTSAHSMPAMHVGRAVVVPAPLPHVSSMAHMAMRGSTSSLAPSSAGAPMAIVTLPPLPLSAPESVISSSTESATPTPPLSTSRATTSSQEQVSPPTAGAPVTLCPEPPEGTIAPKPVHAVHPSPYPPTPTYPTAAPATYPPSTPAGGAAAGADDADGAVTDPVALSGLVNTVCPMEFRRGFRSLTGDLCDGDSPAATHLDAGYSAGSCSPLSRRRSRGRVVYPHSACYGGRV